MDLDESPDTGYKLLIIGSNWGCTINPNFTEITITEAAILLLKTRLFVAGPNKCHSIINYDVKLIIPTHREPYSNHNTTISCSWSSNQVCKTVNLQAVVLLKVQVMQLIIRWKCKPCHVKNLFRTTVPCWKT